MVGAAWIEHATPTMSRYGSPVHSRENSDLPSAQKRKECVS